MHPETTDTAKARGLDDPWKLALLFTSTGAFAVLLWAIAATYVSSSRSKMLVLMEARVTDTTRALADFERELQMARKSAMDQLAATKRQVQDELSSLRTQTERELSAVRSQLDQLETAVEAAIKQVQSADEKYRKEQQRISALWERRLHTIYPGLKRYSPNGDNPIKSAYLDHFKLIGHRITVVMDNTAGAAVRPHYQIRFLNEYGFVTETYLCFWFIERVERGEIRVEEGEVVFKYGNPVYYSVDFLN